MEEFIIGYVFIGIGSFIRGLLGSGKGPVGFLVQVAEDNGAGFLFVMLTAYLVHNIAFWPIILIKSLQSHD